MRTMDWAKGPSIGGETGEGIDRSGEGDEGIADAGAGERGQGGNGERRATAQPKRLGNRVAWKQRAVAGRVSEGPVVIPAPRKSGWWWNPSTCAPESTACHSGSRPRWAAHPATAVPTPFTITGAPGSSFSSGMARGVALSSAPASRPFHLAHRERDHLHAHGDAMAMADYGRRLAAIGCRAPAHWRV